MRLGAARCKVIEIIDAFAEPFSAGELLEAVEQQAPEVGRATVFRTLNTLRAHGLVEQVRLDDGQDVYIAHHTDLHHHHLICTHCSAIQEVTDCSVHESVRTLAKRYGFVPEGHTFDVYGVCADCRES